MASRRMINVSFVDSDSFLNLPFKAQLLYFHLLVRADDDGFVDKPNAIVRTISATKKDLQILENDGFIYSYSSGIVVVMAWNLHNKIRKDMYKPTVYQAEKSHLKVGKNLIYEYNEEAITSQSCNDSVTYTLHSTVQTNTNKDSSDKDSTKQTNEKSSVGLSDGSIYYSLSSNEVISLKSMCEDNHCDFTTLISSVDNSLKAKTNKEPINYPYKYIIGFANNHNWNLTEGSSFYMPVNTSPEKVVKSYKDIKGSLWDKVPDKLKSSMRVLYEDYDIEEIIKSIDTLIKENPEEEYTGTDPSLFRTLADKYIEGR